MGSSNGGGQGAPAHHLAGMRTVLEPEDPRFPAALRAIPRPPKRLYVLGDPSALAEGLAIVGARKATPYGLGLARRFAHQAARRGVCIISGGARGCDGAAHEAALAEGAPTVAFLGGGVDMPYPAEHAGLFERIALSGGAVVSEHAWDAPPLPRRFRTRNRLIAGLARATLIVEAGLPSGTFSTADEALSANRDVLVVPGAITSASSKGANRLLYQGALPIVDDESFSDALFNLFGCLKQEEFSGGASAPGDIERRGDGEAPSLAPSSREGGSHGEGEAADGGKAGRLRGRVRSAGSFSPGDPLVAALQAEPLGMETLFGLARELSGDRPPRAWLMERLAVGEQEGLFARYPDGRWGPRA